MDFVDLGLGMLGCFDCGCVFLTKLARAQAREKPVEVPVVTEEVPMSPVEIGPGEVLESVGSVGFTCDVCEKVLKTKLALAGHMRSHKSLKGGEK